jgi:hypothetical protein
MVFSPDELRRLPGSVPAGFFVDFTADARGMMQRFCWLICGCVVFAGCGGAQVGKPVEVTGEVKLNGEPLAGVTVGYSAIGGLPAEYRYASAVTDDAGMYVIKKVYPAEYMVLLNDTAAEAPAPPPAPGDTPALVHAVPKGGNPALAKYSQQSPLRAAVNADSTTHNFDLKSDGK